VGETPTGEAEEAPIPPADSMSAPYGNQRAEFISKNNNL
jgi:hypothetical protein